jgi:hypothetical protein
MLSLSSTLPALGSCIPVVLILVPRASSLYPVARMCCSMVLARGRRFVRKPRSQHSAQITCWHFASRSNRTERNWRTVLGATPEHSPGCRLAARVRVPPEAEGFLVSASGRRAYR